MKNKDKPDKGKAVAVSNVAEQSEDSDFSLVITEQEDILDLSVGFTSVTNPSSVWILDSGCCYHMCPHREWFCNFREIEGPTVYTVTNNPCLTKGISH